MKLDFFFSALTVMLACVLLLACSKMDATYIDFVKDGERSYATRADSVIIRSGHNRVQVYFLLISDPRISSAKVYWNNRADSVEIPIERTDGIDTIRHIIAGLAEGTYSFEIVTFDRYGAKSIPVSKQGGVYGDRFIASLLDRPVINTLSQEDGVDITFGPPSGDVLGSEVRYTSTDEQQKSVFVSSAQEVLTITDLQAGNRLYYRTLFLPGSTALDTFYSDFNVLLVESLLDKAKFSRWNHPAVPYFTPQYSLPKHYEIENLWDNGAFYNDNYGFYWNSPSPMPMGFTFDLGVSASITKFTVLQQDWYGQLYAGGNIKKFDVYGTNDPNVGGDLSEWEFIGSFNSFKPSGLPLGSTNDDDVNYAAGGEEYTVRDVGPPVRYLRFVIHETWGGLSDTFHITELTLWGRIDTAN